MEYNEQAIRKAMRMAQTPAGQELIQKLSQGGGQELRQAMEKAAAGDMTEASRAMSALLQDPQIKKLLEQMGGK